MILSVPAILLVCSLLRAVQGQTCPVTVKNVGLHPCSTPKGCRCKGSEYICRGPKGSKWTSIPTFQTNVTALDMAENNLGALTAQSLSSPELSTLERLSLHECRIISIAPDTFSHLVHLRYLDLGRNTRISAGSLALALGGLPGSHIEALCLSSMQLNNLDDSFWRGFHGMPVLRRLYLFENNITFFNMIPMTNMTTLTELILSDNYLTIGFVPAILPSLEKLYLAQCRLPAMPKFCKKGEALSSNLRILQLSGNFIRDVKHDDIACLKELEMIDINKNPISKFYTGAFSHNPKLQIVTASHLLGPPSTIQENAFNNSNIFKIVFTNNYLRFNKKRPHKDALTNSGNLTVLDLTGNDLSDIQDSYSHLNLFLKPAQNVSNLSLAYCLLWELPSAVLTFHRLELLNLSHNGLSALPRDLANLTSLRVLDVSYNRITTISHHTFPLPFREFLLQVDFSGNRLNCDCNLLWLIKWANDSRTSTAEGTNQLSVFKTNHTKFLNYPDNYQCAQGEMLNNTGLTEQNCLLSRSSAAILITLVSVIILVLAIVPLVYRFRWHIQFLVFALRYKKERHVRDEEACGITWDAYVSYSLKDRSWVLSRLVPAMEKQRGLHLCVQERDFMPGNLIVDNIVKCMNASRKVLVVLSGNYAADEWCQFELALTHRLALEQGGELLLLLMLSPIPDRQVTKTIFAVLKTHALVTWPLEEDNTHAFWNSLAEAIKKYDP